jgi:CRP-like cAMP-binding protein
VDLAETHGKPSELGVLIDARMTQTELAQMTGISRASVTKLLASFGRQGWLDWNEGMPILLRADLLLRQAGELGDVRRSMDE